MSKRELERKIEHLWKNINTEASKAPTARDAERLGAMVRQVNILEDELMKLD